MLALVIVRGGEVPDGAAETVAECAGRVVLAGDATAELDEAAGELHEVATDITLIELPESQPGPYGRRLAAIVDADQAIVLPASPDGRDVAPHLALTRGCPLYAGALSVSPTSIELVRGGGNECHRVQPSGPFVATLHPGVRTIVELPDPPTIRRVAASDDSDLGRLDQPSGDEPGGPGAVVADAVLPPDAATIDLAEASRIVAGGAGLSSPDRFDQLATLAAALDASVGTTRVVTDRGWLPHERQIGTTGVVVDPQLYLAFAISGAVQHTSGLGRPDHIISVNTDPHCPMMQLADLAIVADANAVLTELIGRLGGTPARPPAQSGQPPEEAGP